MMMIDDDEKIRENLIRKTLTHYSLSRNNTHSMLYQIEEPTTNYQPIPLLSFSHKMKANEI